MSENFKDAILYGANDDVGLARQIAISLAPNSFSKHWQRVRGDVRDLLTYLAAHEEREEKNGASLFFGTLDSAHRKAAHVLTRECLAFDIDKGDGDFDALLTLVRERDVTAAVWTTHSFSNDKPALRLVVPLSAPFVVDRAVSLAETKARWTAAYHAAGEALGLTQWLTKEKRGAAPGRMSYCPATARIAQHTYAPAHRSRAPFHAAINIGTAFDLPLVEVPAGASARVRAAGVDNRPRGLPVPDAGLRVEWGAFLKQYGTRFNAADYVAELGWPVFADNGGKKEIACPNAAEHSDPESESGCAAFNADDADGCLGIGCLHSHCEDMTTADALTLICDQLALEQDPISLAYEFVS